MENIERIHHHDTKFIDQNGHLQTIKIPVVQDLARLKILPGEFIQNPVAAHPFPSHTFFDPIDIAKLRTKSGRATELHKLASICEEWGMFTIRNHGLDPRALEEVEQVVNNFFDLPFEDKKSSVGTYTDADNMGYGRNFFKSQHQPLDWIDRLAMKAAPVGSTQGLRVWPNNPPNFRTAVENFVEIGRQVLDELLEALAEAISCDTHSFSRYFDPKTSEINVRVNYYPSCPRPDLTMGLVPHTDASALTLLAQFGSENGLQVMKSNQWITVPWPCDSLLVNVGDLIEIMSDGRFRSSWHRAVVQPDTGRFSVALLYRPPRGAEIEPVSDGESNKYKNVVVGDYLDNFYKLNPTPTKQAIMFAKFN